MQVSNTVILRSGGPLMTIESVNDGRAYYLWFDGAEKKEAGFDIACLELSR